MKEKEKPAGGPCFPWVGGKRRLLPILSESLPADFAGMETYVEPFVGGGALFFWIRQNFPQVRCVINDSNEHLSNVYRMIRDRPQELIRALLALQSYYGDLAGYEQRKEYFLEQRARYNAGGLDNLVRAALFVFLMRTCYNALYSVNRKGELSMSFGNWKRTNLLDWELIMADSRLLQGVEILDGDYRQSLPYASERSFFYFDPPYKPVSESGGCTPYMPDRFDDPEQVALAGFCEELDSMGVKWMLSNSDPRQKDPENTFFDDLYAHYKIRRVNIFRSICSVAAKREFVNELLITNY